MVTPGSLRQSVADALGLSDQLERVDVHLRNLREAGLISKAKTGRGAAAMGPRDAANLLMAVASSELVKDSVKNVRRYGALRSDPASLSVHGGKGFSETGLPLLDLPSDHTFSDALEGTLTSLGRGDFFREDMWRHFYISRPATDAEEFVFVRFFLPFDAASIFYGSKRRFQVHRLYGSLPVNDARASWDLRNINAGGRLVTLRVVDKVALTAIAKKISGYAPPALAGMASGL